MATSDGDPLDASERPATVTVRIRDVVCNDLPTLYEHQLDVEGNRMAFTHPRTADDFDSHWEKCLKDSNVTVKAITVGTKLAGCISCFKADGRDSIGYWIGNAYWGQGVATQALTLLLNQVSLRPLHARVAAMNVASIRVLQKCGFEIVGREFSPATERFVECEEMLLKLKS